MENNKPFTYQYSAQRNREVENIRRKYMPREVSAMERLRRLDAKVQTAGMIQGLVIGIVGALIFGIGMCFGLDVFGGPDWLTVLFGFLGIGIMIPAYPVARYTAKRTKEELSPQILQLADEIMNR